MDRSNRPPSTVWNGNRRQRPPNHSNHARNSAARPNDVQPQQFTFIQPPVHGRWTAPPPNVMQQLPPPLPLGFQQMRLVAQPPPPHRAAFSPMRHSHVTHVPPPPLTTAGFPRMTSPPDTRLMPVEPQPSTSAQASPDSAATSSTAKQSTEDPWQTAIRQMDAEDRLRKKSGLLVNGRYEIKEKIAFGSYGSIFVAHDRLDPDATHHLAVKFETPLRGGVHLEYEAKVYRIINTTPVDTHPPLFVADNVVRQPPSAARAAESDTSTCSSFADCPTSTSADEAQAIGVPRVHWYGREFKHNIMVLDLLGPTLEQLMPFCVHKIEMPTLLQVARQMLQRIRHVHRCGFIHRDIKPENFLVGLGDRTSTVYLIDFGLARRYRYRAKGQLKHIPFRQNRSLIGTARYASLNSHNGYELSRRDDLESMCYVLLYMVNGSHLPWRDSCRQKYAMHKGKLVAYRRIAKMKNSMSPEQMFPPSTSPPQFAQLLRYARQLHFDQQPDYDLCESMLIMALEQHACPLTNVELQWARVLRTCELQYNSYVCTFKWTLSHAECQKIDANGGLIALPQEATW